MCSRLQENLARFRIPATFSKLFTLHHGSTKSCDAHETLPPSFIHSEINENVCPWLLVTTIQPA